MRNGSDRRRGFTILELLVVISIMAIIATLATGAAIKAVKQSRNKRIDGGLARAAHRRPAIAAARPVTRPSP